MERRLAGMKGGGIPRKEARRLAKEWCGHVELGVIDQRIMDIEAENLAKEWKLWHVKEYGNMARERPDGVWRIMGGQLNSASTAEVRDRKITEISKIVDDWDVHACAFQEMGVNWSMLPSSARLASWFKHERPCKAFTSWNDWPEERISKHQQGGCGIVVFKDMMQYTRGQGKGDFRRLGRWASWLFYATPDHRFRIVSAYNPGTSKPKGHGRIYQQHLRHIQEKGLDTTPLRMFAVDILAVLRTWRKQGDRIILLMDANEHILHGDLVRRIMQDLEMVEATHVHWEGDEPHTWIRGKIPIDAVLHTTDVEVRAVKQLSFHNSVGDHRTVLLDVCTKSAIGESSYRVVRPKARRLTSRHPKGQQRYVDLVEEQMELHKLQERLDRLTAQEQEHPCSAEVSEGLEQLDVQFQEIQRHGEDKCRKIYRGPLEFSLPVRYWDYRKKCYQGLVRRHEGKVRDVSTLIKQCHKAKIDRPKSLTLKQCQDGVKVCKHRLHLLRKSSRGLRKVFLRDRYIDERALGHDAEAKGILQTIEKEEGIRNWKTISYAVDDPKLGAITYVQKKKEGEIIELREQQAMVTEIQEVTEVRFDLAHSAKISLSSVGKKLGYLSDTAFAQELLGGKVEIPNDVDATTTLVLEEIAKVGMMMQTQDGEKIIIAPEQFKRYWKQVREDTSSSISTIHFGHYRAAAKSDKISRFLSQKITLIARTGSPPSRWGCGLQVMLEKIAGVALVNKLRAILLMEADYNYFNKWVFGYEALNALMAEGYIPEDQYSQRQSTAEDARLDSRLTFDISRQLRHPMASTSADAGNCYDRIHHTIMSLLMLAVTGWLGAVVAALKPIQTMKYFQRTAYGDSTTYMGGKRKRPFMGLCQGNGAAPACWSMLAAVLMRCYYNEGFGARITMPISRFVMETMGTIFVDDTNLDVWLPAYRSSADIWTEMQASVDMWGNLLNATGGAFKPEKCYWYAVDYVCEDGLWQYAPEVPFEMHVPLPDGRRVKIDQYRVDHAEKMLGVYSCPMGADDVHLEERVIKRARQWTDRSKNAHLPSHLNWMSYRFKFWAGIRYGIGTLSTPLSVADKVLNAFHFEMLSFLGVNRHIKRGWRTLPRTFGGVGLLSFSIEQMICWLNMLLQHFGVPSTLGRKFQASLEALQLEVGCKGCPLVLDYSIYEHLATPCWMKSFWERLWHYKFRLYLAYTELPFPRERDKTLMDIFLAEDCKGEELLRLNRCRVYLNLLFLSDMATANGRGIERVLLGPGGHGWIGSSYVWPREEPTKKDWSLWIEFWTNYTRRGLILPTPLGKWTGTTHRSWKWYYDRRADVLQCVSKEGTTFFEATGTRRTRGSHLYMRSHHAQVQASGVPASVEHLEGGQVRLLNTGTRLAVTDAVDQSFWEFLKSWGGEWMWDHIEDPYGDTVWMAEAIANGTAVLVTDGSYDRGLAPQVSGAGWTFCCRRTERIVRGSFYEVSPSASAYRGELLGLVALHTLSLALTSFYQVDRGKGKMCCDNIGALNQSSKWVRRVRTGSKQSDLLRAIRSCKIDCRLAFVYHHVKGHQDRHLLWHQLALEAQLNVKCDGLAKSAVQRWILFGADASRGLQLLPREKAAVFIEGVKLTTDVAKEVRYCLGEEEARRFYTGPNTKKHGGLGWSARRFDLVDWRGLEAMLAGKPDAFSLWLSKQVAGVCATRKNMARIQDLLDDKCPNCLQPKEDAAHLTLCGDDGRQRLFRDGVTELGKWMSADNRTQEELAFWIEKWMLLRGSVKFGEMGPMSRKLRELGAELDEIGWRAFTEGRVPKRLRRMQTIHCQMSPCRMNGDDWIKGFIGRVVHIAHSQWIYRNFTLHERSKGYLRLKERVEVLEKIEGLMRLGADKVPEESQYLLEVDFGALVKSSHEQQSYWVRAVEAARTAGRRAARRLAKEGAGARRRRSRRRPEKPCIDIKGMLGKLRQEIGLEPTPSRTRPHPDAAGVNNKANKRLRKPD